MSVAQHCSNDESSSTGLIYVGLARDKMVAIYRRPMKNDEAYCTINIPSLAERRINNDLKSAALNANIVPRRFLVKMCSIAWFLCEAQFLMGFVSHKKDNIIKMPYFMYSVYI